jgi:hypothetical protein
MFHEGNSFVHPGSPQMRDRLDSRSNRSGTHSFRDLELWASAADAG